MTMFWEFYSITMAAFIMLMLLFSSLTLYIKDEVVVVVHSS